MGGRLVTGQRVITKRYQFTGPYEDLWIDLDADPTMATFESFQSLDKNDYGRALALLTVASNVTDRAGEPLDLTVAENWRKVNRGLVEQSYKFMEDLFAPFAVKTTSSAITSNGETSTPAATSTSPGDTSA